MKAPAFLTALLATFLISTSLSAQERQGNNRRPQQTDISTLSPEERKDLVGRRIDQQISRYSEEMGEFAPSEEQLPTFTRLIGSNVIESLKLQAQVQQARKKNKGNMRDTMMAMRDKREKLSQTLLKGMKELLDKKQYKAFKKAKEKLTPERRGPGGGGGGGRGPGGGGGGGGGRGPQ